MASVKAPLMSLDASGTIGRAFTFSKWKGRNYVRRHAVPSNPRSDGQLSTRAVFKYLSQIWATLGTPGQTYWNTVGEATGITGLNAMVRACMSDWATFAKFAIDPEASGQTAAAPVSLGETPAVRAVVLDFTEAADIGDTNCYIVQVTGPTVNTFQPTKVRHIVPAVIENEVHTLTISGLISGEEYDWGIVAMCSDGTQAAFAAGANFTVL